MKYFKYRFNYFIGKRCYRKRIKLLGKKESRVYYARKALFVLNAAFFVFSAAALIVLCKYIGGIEKIGKGLRLFLQICVGASILILPLIIAWLIFKIIDKLLPYRSIPEINKKAVIQCARPLIKYYEISGDYIVTKCYKCSAGELTNKDLLLFVHNGNLRIVNDFTSTVKDFGCYEIPKTELQYCYKNENGLLSTYIKCGDMELSLGRRAKPFITKNIFNKTQD